MEDVDLDLSQLYIIDESKKRPEPFYDTVKRNWTIRNQRYCVIILLILLFLCSIFALIILICGFCLPGDVEKIHDDTFSNINENKTKHPLVSFAESTQYPTIHFIENFYLTILLTSIMVYYVINSTDILKLRLYYISSFSLTIMIAAKWEIIEQTIVIIPDILTYYGIPAKDIFYKPPKESLGDVILNDMVQSAIASTMVLTLIYFQVIKPVSWLLFNSKWYMIFSRIIIWATLELTVFLGDYKKSFGWFNFNFGFYSVLFFKLIGVIILHIEDILTLKQDDLIDFVDVNKCYILIYAIHIALWLSTFNLLNYGIFSSNIAAILVIIGFCIINWYFFIRGKRPQNPLPNLSLTSKKSIIVMVFEKIKSMFGVFNDDLVITFGLVKENLSKYKWCIVIQVVLLGVYVIIAIFLILFGVFFKGVDKVELNTDNVDEHVDEDVINKHPLDSILEKTHWPTNHFLENFYLTILSDTILLYYIKDLADKWCKPSGKKILHYVGTLGIVVMLAVKWEAIEAIIFTITEILEWVGVDEKYIIYKFGSESIIDIVLLDFGQGILGGIIVLLFIYFEIIKPVSWLLFNTKWYMVILRTIIWISLNVITFGGIFKKKFGWFNFNFGFYAVLFLKLTGITILHMEDILTLKSDDPLDFADVNKCYILIYIMHIVLWISTGNLRAWGFFSSNIAAVLVFFCYWICILIYNKRIKKK